MNVNQEIEYIKPDILKIKIHSLDPAPKGVRAKAQKYLKDKGIKDAWCFIQDQQVIGENETLVTVKIISATISLIQITEELTKGVSL